MKIHSQATTLIAFALFAGSNALADCDGCDADIFTSNITTGEGETLSGYVTADSGMCAPNCRPLEQCYFIGVLDYSGPAYPVNISQAQNTFLEGQTADPSQWHAKFIGLQAGPGYPPFQEMKVTCGNEILGWFKVGNSQADFWGICSACTTN